MSALKVNKPRVHPRTTEFLFINDISDVLCAMRDARMRCAMRDARWMRCAMDAMPA